MHQVEHLRYKLNLGAQKQRHIDDAQQPTVSLHERSKEAKIMYLHIGHEINGTQRQTDRIAYRVWSRQLKTLQAQNMTGEEQFVRSMEREKELRGKLEVSEKAAEEARGFLKENVELGQQVRACIPHLLSP